MQFIEFNSTLCTIEQLDNTIGHIKSNCVLACRTCNYSRVGQWQVKNNEIKPSLKCTVCTKKFRTFSKRTPFEILASNNNKQFDYLVRWYANMIQGNKNTTALYFKGLQGIGKSTISDFISNHVLGKSISLKCNNAMNLKEKFNSDLMGKLFVVYEELPTFSSNEWSAVSGILKDCITSSQGQYESKGKDPIEA